MVETTLGDGCIRQEDGARWAVFSECRTYRYLLGRVLTSIESRGHDPTRVCLFVMLNPSTADALKDDPTIRRCTAWAQRWGFDELRVVNLFAYRSPHPKDLLAARCPNGPLNMMYLAWEVGQAERVVAAWGNPPCRAFAKPIAQFVEWLPTEWRAKVVQLGETALGEPKHPLARGRHRIPDDVEPVAMFGGAG